MMKIREITTDKGFKSILEESDSLRDSDFLERLTADLNTRNFFDVDDQDTTLIVLSLGEPNEVVGATHGYLFLKYDYNGYKVDRYRAGK